MPRTLPRLAAVFAMIASGCLACAFSFLGSGSSEAKRERDTQEILKLFDEGIASEQEGDFTKALGLYAKAQDKTYAFDKAHPKEDPTTMQLIRTRCTVQIENIRFNMARQTNESPVAVTPAQADETPTPAEPQPQTGFTVPSRNVDGTTRPPRQDVKLTVTQERVTPVIVAGASSAQAVFQVEAPATLEPAMSIADQVEWARDRMELGQPEKALEDLRAVLGADPDHLGARFLYALASFQCGDNETADSFLADLAHDAPSEAVYLLLGALRFQEKNLNAALAAVRKARELNPKSAAAFLNEAVVLLEIPGTPPGLAATAYRQAQLLGAARDPALEARLNPQPTAP